MGLRRFSKVIGPGYSYLGPFLKSKKIINDYQISAVKKTKYKQPEHAEQREDVKVFPFQSFQNLFNMKEGSKVIAILNIYPADELKRIGCKSVLKGYIDTIKGIIYHEGDIFIQLEDLQSIDITSQLDFGYNILAFKELDLLCNVNELLESITKTLEICEKTLEPA